MLLYLHLETTQDFMRVQPSLSTDCFQRPATAVIIDTELAHDRFYLRVIDQPVGHRCFKSTVRHACHSDFRNECPVLIPAMNNTSATAPRKKMVSPGTRIQRHVCIVGVCMNSALRAYQ